MLKIFDEERDIPTLEKNDVKKVVKYLEDVTTVTDIAASESTDPGVNISFPKEMTYGRMTHPIASVYYNLRDNEFPVIIVSSMDGCYMNCAPCGAGRIRFIHTAEQMFFQAYKAHQAAGIGDKPFVISLTGSGDPTYRISETLRLIPVLESRYPKIDHLLISSMGMKDGIDELIDAIPNINIPVKLQLSLHGTNDNDRKGIVTHSQMNIEELLEAGEAFYNATGNRVCLNYMVARKNPCNMGEDNAKWLAGIDTTIFSLKLVKINPAESKKWSDIVPASSDELEEFANLVRSDSDKLEVITPTDGASKKCGTIGVDTNYISSITL